MDSLTILVLAVSFFLFLLVGVPISFAIGLSAFLSLVVMLPADIAAQILAQKILTALDSFGLLAIPLFILAADLMNIGSLADRLLVFCQALVGRFRGG
ncbi:MAG: TRAP transporter large permease subunit, partial [Candidatus Eremiobacteraeota bacterium]|nr:TRAP transporter large permease subunit [Candidatus Eremiobacteraeota bacterium]